MDALGLKCVWIHLSVIVVLTELTLVTLSAPQYGQPFVRTNTSKKTGVPPYDEVMGNGGGHHERHYNKETLLQLTTGSMKGLRRSVLGKDVYVYYGVPFAEPPIGDLRFKKPVHLKSWGGRLDAIRLPNSCVQERYENFANFAGEEMWNPNTNISEDCLYLNLWVPKNGLTRMKNHLKNNNNLDTFQGLPILIWLYGGGYMAGTSSLEVYNADVLAGENDVIVATVNYRVGAFGFLYTGTEDAPGNQGLYDQVAAMEWIRDNALRFGGDPDSMTLFGESAGGGSVSFHLLSPISRHLLKRGIMQSGTLNAPWSVMSADDAKTVAVDLVRDAGCNGTKTIEEGVACLRELPAQNISTLQWNSYRSILAFPSAPTIDGHFLPRHPNQMLREGDFKRTELMLGSNKNEGTYFVLYDFLSYFKKDVPSCLSRDKFLQIITLMFPNRTQLEKEAILFQYTHWDDVKDEAERECKNGELVHEVAGDYFFICPTNYFAEAYSAHNLPVYYYYFTHRTSSNPWGEWMGVIHGEEVEYVFGHPLRSTQNHTVAETELSRRVMKHFVRFAATGSPVGEDEDVDWPLYTRQTPNYFILNGDLEQGGTGRGPRTQACAFWNEFIPLIAPGTESLPSRCGRERWDINEGRKLDISSLVLIPILLVLFVTQNYS